MTLFSSWKSYAVFILDTCLGRRVWKGEIRGRGREYEVQSFTLNGYSHCDINTGAYILESIVFIFMPEFLYPSSKHILRTL